MKKILVLLVLSLVSGRGFAQNLDSLAVVREVDSLIKVAGDLRKSGRPVEAMPVAETAKSLCLIRLGNQNLQYAACLNILGVCKMMTGQLEAAEPLLLESRAIKEKILGKEDPDYGRSLNHLGILYYLLGRYEIAESFYLETKAVWEKSLGREHPDYARCVYNFGHLYGASNRPDMAESLFLEAKAIQEKTLGTEHPEYAKTLGSLASLYAQTGKLELAEPLYMQEISIAKRAKEGGDASQVSGLANLALLYRNMGRFESAEPLYLEAKALHEKVFGEENPNYAQILNNLAALYGEMGDYESSESLHREALEIRARVLGKTHPDYAQSLSNLATAYAIMGNFKMAEPLIQEALTVRETMLGKNHRDYASTLGNLGSLYREMGQYDAAEKFFLEARDIYEKTLGKETSFYATTLSGLAVVYDDINRDAEAEALLLEAKAVQEKVLGKEHPEYAVSLHNLAALYWNTERDELAEPLYLETKAIQEKVLGKQHVYYLQNLHKLILLYYKRMDWGRVAEALTEAAGTEQRIMLRGSTFTSEREMVGYARKISRSSDLLNSFAYYSGAVDVPLNAVAFDNSLFHKGFLLQGSLQIRRAAQQSDDSTKIIFDKWRGLQRRLATLYTKPIAERTGIENLEGQADDLERQLVRRSAAFMGARLQINWQQVQQKLKPEEAALEFIHFQYQAPQGATDSTLYAALLLRPDWPQPRMVALFEQKQLDTLLRAEEGRKADYANRLYTSGSALYDLIWKPLEKELSPAFVPTAGKAVKTIYFAPSGALHRINFDAIPTGPGALLSDRYQLVQMGSTRQLVVPPGTATANNDAALFGGIRYEADSTVRAQPLGTLLPDETSLTSRGALTFNTLFDSTLRGGAWEYLPFTEREVSGIETILAENKLKPLVRRGEAATEEAFKRLGQSGASPRVLHVATHGFFFPDPAKTPDDRRRAMDGDNTTFKLSDNPMMRSGLLLAGANRVWKGEPQIENLEDGILTAYEISQMNLSNTELVVLSACETGLGDIQGNEGVYGLQRAFKIAGARYVILSLWQVPDKQTSQLMTTFYRNWLEHKMSIPEAFRAAQKQMRDLGLEPFKWAGFVLIE